MADEADIAGLRIEAELAARASMISADIPAGIAGECDDCGEHMPRLVGGRCAFCRDGRRPPLATYDRLDRAPVIKPVPMKETNMANPKPSENRQQISVPAEGRALHVIRERADEKDLPLGRAALSIIEDFIERMDGAEWGEVPTLEGITIEALMAELGRRVASATPEQIAEANDRAQTAERRLAAVTAALAASA